MKETKKLKEKIYEGMYKNPTSHISHHTSERAITLIALVITIIVMLILVAVTITVAINGGLFDYAGKAASKTGEARDAEQNLANGRVNVGDTWYNNIDDYLNNIPSEDQQEPKGELPEGIKVGDYVNYTPTPGTYPVTTAMSGYSSPQTFETQEGDSALKWRVWSIDKKKGTVELVAEKQTTDQLYLGGADGYNHAVDILNDFCKKLYSNGNAIARSINVEDINSKTTFKPETYTDYGKKYTPTRKQYPNIYTKELGSTASGLEDKTEGLLTGSQGVRLPNGDADYETYTGSTTETNTLNVTFTYYSYTPEAEDQLNKELGENNAVKGLITTESAYWLASRCILASSSLAFYNVRILSSSGDVNRNYLFYSDGTPLSNPCAVRPIVSLPISTNWTKATTEINSTQTWDITL